MIALVAGLVVFLGLHSIRVVAPRWREAQIARIGERRWKLAFSAASILGLLLLIWGYGIARAGANALWTAPAWAPHVTAVLAVIAFVLVAAAYIPGTHFKSALGHPMTAGIGLWAFGHLLSNGGVQDVVLFGAFLAWAIIVFAMRRHRDRAAGVAYAPGDVRRDAIALVAGIVAALVFALWLHGPLIGVRPFR
jgi:uncharacterized membrane protein